jgi:hypothetical protein
VELIKIGIREVKAEDARWINRYWAESTDADLKRLGETQRPDPQENIEFLEHFCSNRLSPREAQEAILVWTLDGTSIGYQSLKEIRFGKDAQTHLHLAVESLRGKGLGAPLFCLSALKFIKDFELKELYCQPKFDNPMPNGMLRRVGFPFLGTVDYTYADTGAVVKQNRYQIRKDIAEKFLGSARETFKW